MAETLTIPPLAAGGAASDKLSLDLALPDAGADSEAFLFRLPLPSACSGPSRMTPSSALTLPFREG